MFNDADMLRIKVGSLLEINNEKVAEIP